MKLLIVIVNYRSADLTIDCLRSLVPELASVPGTRVVVTDNLSPDDSVIKLQTAITNERWSDWCELRPLPKNGGFAYGNNEAIRPFLKSLEAPEYVLLLNPDTLVRPNAMVQLINYLDDHRDVGIVGSRLEDPDGTAQRSAFRFHTIGSELENGLRLGIASRLLANYIVAPEVQNHAHRTDWVAGASMMIRKAVFDRIGLLDDGYFMYFEEVDFCRRANQNGFACWYLPTSRVVHLVGQSSGVTDQKKPMKRRPRYWFEARRRYFRKHLGLLRTILADLAWSGGYGLFRLRNMVQRKPTNDPPGLWWDFVRFNFWW